MDYRVRDAGVGARTLADWRVNRTLFGGLGLAELVLSRANNYTT